MTKVLIPSVQVEGAGFLPRRNQLSPVGGKAHQPTETRASLEKIQLTARSRIPEPYARLFSDGKPLAVRKERDGPTMLR